MKTTIFIISILLLCLLASCAENENKPLLEVLASHELTFTPTNEKQKYKKSSDVIYKPGNGFGWYMIVRSNKKEFEITEVLHLPAPGAWADDNKLIISNDKKNAIAKVTKPNNGFITHMWGIAKGDPKGDYTIDIYVENKHIKTFYYNVK